MEGGERERRKGGEDQGERRKRKGREGQEWRSVRKEGGGGTKREGEERREKGRNDEEKVWKRRRTSSWVTATAILCTCSLAIIVLQVS